MIKIIKKKAWGRMRSIFKNNLSFISQVSHLIYIKSRHNKRDVVYHFSGRFFYLSFPIKPSTRRLTWRAMKSCGQMCILGLPKRTRPNCHVALIFIEFVIEMESDRRVFFARRRTLCTVQMYTRVYILQLERYIHIIYIYRSSSHLCSGDTV